HTQVVSAVLDAVEKLERDAEPVDTLVVGVPRRLRRAPHRGHPKGKDIVGGPRRLDGSPNEQTPKAEQFVAALRAATTRTVVAQDERLTSHEADERLGLRERDWEKSKGRLHPAAGPVPPQG